MEEQKLLRKKTKAFNDGNKTAVLSFCADLAEIYMNDGQYKKAIDEYKLMADIYKENGSEIDYARANRGLCEAYMGLRNFQAALEHQHIYLDIAKKENDELETQRALATLGHIYLSRYLDEADTSPPKSYLNSAYKYFTKSLIACENLQGISKFERADMSARIFSNLGVVYEGLGKFDKAVELLNKSVNICKANDVFEQLYRSYIALGSLHEKSKKFKDSIQYYNLAFELAKKLKEKIPMMCSSLLSKGDVLLKLGDFSAAKSSLYKAYKLKSPVLEDRTQVEHNLRVVVALCQIQQKLLSTPDSDYTELKNLYEKMGDGCCDIKNYDKAIEYYHKMLRAVQNSGEESGLKTCYFSLAETYRDNKQYNEALEYYNKEYELCQDLKDALNTLIKIAECTEFSGYPSAEIRAVYEMGIRRCRSDHNIQEECRLLVKYIAFLRRSGINAEAFKFEQSLSEMNCALSDTESDHSENQATPTIGDDIALSDITDISDTSDTEEVAAKRPARRNKNYTIKRNMKGETALHTACIAGQLTVVKHLLDQGHPVNVRDHCGWLPLHEACICGHLEIVELLLDHGASINDRGGSLCRGVTPLHDAASNGHLNVVELLINRGASLVVKTDDGDTIIHYLQTWRGTVKLQSDEIILYESIIQRIKNALEKSGQSLHTIQATTLASPKTQSQYICGSPRKKIGGLQGSGSKRLTGRRSSKRSRRSSDSWSSEGCESDSAGTSSEVGGDAAEEYRSVMNELRHKNQTDTQRSRASTSTRIPALVNSDDVIDDWLIDDLMQNNSNKRRKTSGNYTNNLLSRNNSFEKNSPCSSNKSASPRRVVNRTPVLPDRSPVRPTKSPFKANLTSELCSIGVSQSVAKRRQSTQISLLDSGFEQHRSSPVKSTRGGKRSSNKPKRAYQTRLTNFGSTQHHTEADSTTRSPTKRHSLDMEDVQIQMSATQASETVLSMDPTLSVDVRIEGRLYRVPVLMSQTNTRTIKWLAEEAALRYAKKEFIKPVLELETKSGAVLADEDLVSLLFTAGSVQAEEAHAKVVEWNIPSISERYKEACSQSNITPNSMLLEKLQALSVHLDLSNQALRNSMLNPLFKALNRQSSLLELNLSGNFLSVDNVRLLASSFSTLKGLRSLNLSCTGLQLEHMHAFASTIASIETPAANLHELNLSFNFLGSNCIPHLETISRLLRIRIISLADCNLTSDAFKTDCLLQFQELEELDLSCNSIDTFSLGNILNCLNPDKMSLLNLSNNIIDRNGIMEIVKFAERSVSCNLSVLHLSRCNCEDTEVFTLLRSCPKLRKVILSYNGGLTSISLRRLISHDFLQAVDLSGCSNIFKYFIDWATANVMVGRNLRDLKISIDQASDPEKFAFLSTSWTNMNGDKAVVNYMSKFLWLSLK